MANKATEQLGVITSIDPSNDYLLVKQSGVAELQRIAPKDTYFGKLELVVCILRFTSGSPNTVAFIDEGVTNAHRKLNFDAVSLDETKVMLTFGRTFAAVGAVMAHGDDQLAALTFGTEVTASGVDIYMVDAAGNAINPQTNTAITATNNAVWVMGVMWPAV